MMSTDDQPPASVAATNEQRDAAVDLITGAAPRRLRERSVQSDLALVRLEHEQDQAPTGAVLMPPGLPPEG